MPSGEIITIHIGGFGVKLGEDFWKHKCKDLGVDYSGSKTNYHVAESSAYFKHSTTGKLIPRAIFADLTNGDINCIQNFDLKNLFNNRLMSLGKEDSGLYSTSHFVGGPKIIEKIMKDIKSEHESCDNLSGFMIFNSFAGGVGSGLGSLVLSKLKDYNPEIPVVTLNMSNSKYVTYSNISDYNEILALHQ